MSETYHNSFGARKPSALGFVYCIRDGYKGTVKIGFSNNPNRRLQQLQTASATHLELCGVIETVQSFEKFLHHVFRDRHVFGEWFDDADEGVSTTFKTMRGLD
jgi:hypothetical protein